jgi:hypothetical protein
LSHDSKPGKKYDLKMYYTEMQFPCTIKNSPGYNFYFPLFVINVPI